MTFRRALLALALLVAPLAGRAQEPQKLTIDTSGWLILNTYSNYGKFDGTDLPRFAVIDPTGEFNQTGMAVRQSRFRMNIGIPTDGLLGNAKLKGFVEADFAGSRANAADLSTVQPRLRHAYVQATWKDLGNLSLLVGQSWGVAPGPYFASSISHIVMPRFGGAGFLFRRAPQVKVMGDVPVANLGLVYSVAALAPVDSAGEESGMPDLEGRVAGAFRPGGKQMAEVGFFTHYGREKYSFTGAAGAGKSETVSSQVYGVDAKVDLPYVQLLGGAWQGENLDALYSIAGFEAAAGAQTLNQGVVKTDTATAFGVENIKSRGAWAQAVVSPMKTLQVILGAGVEDPDQDTFPATDAGRITQNRQLSGGVLLNLTSKWRVGVEYSRYVTSVRKTTGDDTFGSNQVELSTLLAL